MFFGAIDRLTYSNLKCELEDLRNENKKLKVDNNTYKKRIEGEFSNASFAIDWDTMNVFSVERNWGHGYPVTILGYLLSEPVTHTEEQVTFKTIQKLTGKLTQKIRTLDNEEGMTSENIKYVINMVLSSLDLKSLSEEDKDDIMSKFEEAEEREDGGDDMGGKDMTDDTEVEDIQADMDVPVEGAEMAEYGNGAIMDSIFKESKVDKVISKYFEVTKQEIRESANKNAQKQIKIKSDVKKKMDSVIKLTETIEQELAAKKFLEKNSNYNFIGITNKKNLVFENNGKQKRISTEGNVI
jgi:hypothetical protein